MDSIRVNQFAVGIMPPRSRSTGNVIAKGLPAQAASRAPPLRPYDPAGTTCDRGVTDPTSKLGLTHRRDHCKT